MTHMLWSGPGYVTFTVLVPPAGSCVVFADSEPTMSQSAVSVLHVNTPCHEASGWTVRARPC